MFARCSYWNEILLQQCSPWTSIPSLKAQSKPCTLISNELHSHGNNFATHFRARIFWNCSFPRRDGKWHFPAVWLLSWEYLTMYSVLFFFAFYFQEENGEERFTRNTRITWNLCAFKGGLYNMWVHEGLLSSYEYSANIKRRIMLKEFLDNICSAAFNELKLRLVENNVWLLYCKARKACSGIL